MCLQRLKQSTSNGCRDRRILLMATAITLAAIIATVIIIVVLTAADDSCMDNLQCLPISKCVGHVNPDFIYGCGSHDFPKICCLANLNGTENTTNRIEIEESPETASRLAKMKLFPKKCGIGDFEDKIAHGRNAMIGQYPWMAILGYTEPRIPFVLKLCGGTIINSRYILTAAHCAFIENFKLHQVTLGELNLGTSKDCNEEKTDCSDDPIDFLVEDIIVHEKFNRTSLKNDIALLRLEKEIPKFTDFIKPICLPFGLKIDEDYFLSRNFTITGWGLTSPSDVGVANILQYTIVKAWESNKCNEALKKPYSPIGNRQVCATGPDYQEACKGDSGGPMTFNHNSKTTQIGVVSFKSVNTCGTDDVPTVFTRVDRYLDWILDNITP